MSEITTLWDGGECSLESHTGVICFYVLRSMAASGIVGFWPQRCAGLSRTLRGLVYYKTMILHG